jgi:threonine synthase
LLSTTTVCLKTVLNSAANARVTKSVLPPGGNGTTTLMAWLGKSAAFADKVIKQIPKKITNRFSEKLEIMISP